MRPVQRVWPNHYLTMKLDPHNTLTKDRLLAHCRAFIEAQNITCAETVHQTDRVIENAYEFIEGICDIVGYKEMN